MHRGFGTSSTARKFGWFVFRFFCGKAAKKRNTNSLSLRRETCAENSVAAEYNLKKTFITGYLGTFK